MCISTGGRQYSRGRGNWRDVAGVDGMVGGQTSKDESSKSSQDRTDGAGGEPSSK